MDALIARLDAITRPPLLVQAARFGLEHYRRLPALRRLLGTEDVPPCAVVLARLLALEAEMEEKRRHATADYRVARHVALVVALMHERAGLGMADILPFPAVA